MKQWLNNSTSTVNHCDRGMGGGLTPGKPCLCTCLHTVHPVANHGENCPEAPVTVALIKDSNGNFTVAEVSNYTYTDEATARAFARDKWGDKNPVVVTAGDDFFPPWIRYT